MAVVESLAAFWGASPLVWRFYSRTFRITDTLRPDIFVRGVHSSEVRNVLGKCSLGTPKLVHYSEVISIVSFICSVQRFYAVLNIFYVALRIHTRRGNYLSTIKAATGYDEPQTEKEDSRFSQTAQAKRGMIIKNI